MRITIAEQFYDDWQHDNKSPLMATRDAISLLESRIVALEQHYQFETGQDHVCSKEMCTSPVYMNGLCRIHLYHHEIPENKIVVASEHPKDGREWIIYDYSAGEPKVWLLFDDDSIGLCKISSIGFQKLTVVAWMPYHKGDKQPDPPEVK